MRVLILATLLCSTSYAIEPDKVNHFAAVYAIQTVSYGISSHAFRMERTDALVFSAAVTSMVWFTKEMFDAGKTRRLDGGDILANVAGQAAAIGTVFVFDF